MSAFGALQDHLDRIENRAADRPGEALDDLETVVASLDDVLVEHNEQAQALVQNEDLAGAAHVLGQNALVLQQTALLALKLREQIRRRR